MMTFRWSWIFILNLLLVQLGSATVPNDNHIVNDIHQRSGDETSYRVFDFLVPDQPKKPNIGAIVGGVIGGLTFTLVVLGWCFVSRRRRIAHVEEGARSPGLKRPDGLVGDPKSVFSPDGKGGKFDRIRDVLGRRPRKPLENILPVYQVALPPGSTDTIGRPPPAAPNHAPRYPSVLERGSNPKRRPTPPPLEGYPDLSSASSVTDGVPSTDVGERPGRRKVQAPPKALMVPTPGRPLPGLAIASARSAGMRPPKSPSRRRSWFAKHPFKHPFIPIRSIDTNLRFPPGSPLYPGQYQPSPQHLAARFSGRSPRIESPLTGSMSAKQVPPSSRRQPAPLDEDPGSTKQARLMEALQSADLEGARTPTGARTALPPNSSRLPLGSSRFLPDPPTTSYI